MQESQYMTKEDPLHPFCISSLKNTAVLAAAHWTHTSCPVLPNALRALGIWLKSLQDNQSCPSHTDTGQERSKETIRWEEVTECKELARGPWPKGRGQSNTFSQPRRVSEGCYTSYNTSNGRSCRYFALQSLASANHPAHSSNTLIIYISLQEWPGNCKESNYIIILYYCFCWTHAVITK